MIEPARIRTIPLGPWKVNCYLVHDGETGLVIDPGDEPAILIETIAAERFQPVAVLCTHGHFDHVGAVSAVKQAFDVPLLLHAADKRLLGLANLYRRLSGDNAVFPIPTVDRFFGEPGGSLTLGRWTIDVLHTPGHTPGSVCLRVEGWLFSGDTLFARSVGRTDLPGGDRDRLSASLAVLGSLPKGLMLFPGHGNPGILGEALAVFGRELHP